jgi:molybdopterin molybdotransferase
MPREFIPVSEAKKLITDTIIPLLPVKVSLNEAAGLVLAQDIFSITDVPPFNQSSMDGYALNFEGWEKNRSLLIDGVAQAGQVESIPLKPQNARRIFTGAAVPPGADTVVMQEKTSVNNGGLTISDSNTIKGLNVRLQGSEAKAGELALEKNCLLSPGAIGFIAGLGIHELLVFPQPSVSIILTGNELQQPGLPLEHGQVYESNSFALKAALNQTGISIVTILSSEDILETLTSVLSNALQQSDLVLLTGGVSVGDYDFVIRAAEANGIEQIFHKIKQKPGKPIYFGKKGKKYIFGLPGNPGSVMTCFYEYVYPAIGLLNNRKIDLKQIQTPINSAQKKAPGLTHFLKGFYDGNKVHDLKAQESFRLSSFAKANCLIKLEEDQTEITEGQLVEIHMLPPIQ